MPDEKHALTITADPEYVAMITKATETLGQVAELLIEVRNLFLETLKGSLQSGDALPDLPEAGTGHVENKGPA